MIFRIYSTSLQPKEKCAHLRNSLKDCAPHFIKVLFPFLCAKIYISQICFGLSITINEYYVVEPLIMFKYFIFRIESFVPIFKMWGTYLMLNGFIAIKFLYHSNCYRYNFFSTEVYIKTQIS